MGIASRYKKFKDKNDVKSFKLILLILLLVVGTMLLIKKSNPLNNKLQNYLKANIPSVKNFNPIDIKYIGRLDTPTAKLLNIKSQYLKNCKDLKAIKIYEDKFRLNDTLYRSYILVDKNDSLLLVNSPVKW